MKIKFIKEEPQVKNLKLNLKSGRTISKKYVDDIQTVIAPTTPQITKSESNEFNIDNTIKDIKMKSAMKLVNLAINKGIIEANDKDFELQKILVLDDESFKSYQDEILNFDNTHNVTSKTGEDDNLTEAERVLKRIRGGENNNPYFNNSNNSNNYNETRDLSQNNNRKIIDDLYNGKLPSFKEEDFNKIMLEKIEENIQNDSSDKNEFKYIKKETKGFENIQGLKKPIQIPSKQSTYKDSLSELDWTTVKRNI